MDAMTRCSTVDDDMRADQSERVLAKRGVRIDDVTLLHQQTPINAHFIAIIDHHVRAHVIGSRVIGIPVSGDLVIATDVNAVEQLS